MENMINVLKDLIAIKSVTGKVDSSGYPYGKEVNEALQFVLNLSKDFGFRIKNLDNKIGYAEIGSGKEMIGILFHLDVVPPGNGWKTDPFTLTEIDGKLYGRGVIDDKGPGIATLFALKDILKEKSEINKRIRVIFGLQEEQGDWLDIKHYINNEEIPDYGFTPDGDFPLIQCEKGILQGYISFPFKKSNIISFKGGESINMVPDKCVITIKTKNYQNTVLSEQGKSAHGSTPEEGINAISKLIKSLSQRTDFEDPFIQFYEDHIGYDNEGNKLNCNINDDLSGKLTCSANMLKMELNEIKIFLDIRYPVTYTKTEIINRIKFSLPKGVEYTELSSEEPIYLDKNSEVLKALFQAYEKHSKNREDGVITGGGTYARAMKNIVAFGPGFPGKENTEHQANEYIYKDDFILLRKIYKTAIENLLDLG